MARSTILVLSASVTRRYEYKFDDWPYKLWALASDESTPEQRDVVADEVLSVDRRLLDVYTLVFVEDLFSTREALLRPEARFTVKVDFECVPVSTTICEWLGSELVQSHPARAPAGSWIHASRESVLRQASALRIARGGEHPLVPSRASHHAQ
jgi:hypothetical protein